MTTEAAHATFLNASVQELLMIEMVNMTYSLIKEQKAETPIKTQIHPNEEEDLTDRELLETKLESIGYRVGHGLIERFSGNVPITTLQSHLDMIKFICKDLWTLLFNKQIDNLKTNHRGVYVLVDNNFRWFSKMSIHPMMKTPTKEPIHSPFLWYPCGLIRGALANLGMEAIVIAESPNGFPGITFQIKVVQKEQ